MSVVVYDGAGNVVYTSSGVRYNSDSENWQSFFEGSHSITFLTSYTVVIAYTLEGDDEVYTATFDSSSVYPEGSYYPINGNNAWKIYAYLYGYDSLGGYDEDTSDEDYEAAYEELVEAGTVTTTDLDISGMSIYLIASILCDSSSVTGKGTVKGDSRWGVDFALSVETLKANGANFNMEVEKTYTGGSMDAGMFTFYLYSATLTTVDENSYWVLGSLIETETNSATTDDDEDGITTDSIDFSRIAYSTSDAGQTFYYVIYEENGGTTVNGIAYDPTIYGVEVTISTTTSTVGTVTTTNTVVSVTYYTLTAVTDGDGNVLYYEATPTTDVTTSTSGEAEFTFTNTTAETTTTSLTIIKMDADDDDTYLAGAQFYLYYMEGETAYYYSYDENDGSVSWVNDQSSATVIETNSDGETVVEGLSLGITYYLEEITAPDGYNLLSNPIQFELDEYGLTLYLVNNEASVNEDEDGDYTLYVFNSKGYELPSTGGMGTWMYTLIGLLLCSGAALVLYRRKRLS
ncbi:MAG: LPXTG cell wall anchor domain-containing protein [Lachnospiraceae bacterium]|nr:LPXTG cell wall anchor domain-containing protein [Lachnospiraceae bacterium]